MQSKWRVHKRITPRAFIRNSHFDPAIHPSAQVRTSSLLFIAPRTCVFPVWRCGTFMQARRYGDRWLSGMIPGMSFEVPYGQAHDEGQYNMKTTAVIIVRYSGLDQKFYLRAATGCTLLVPPTLRASPEKYVVYVVYITDEEYYCCSRVTLCQGHGIQVGFQFTSRLFFRLTSPG